MACTVILYASVHHHNTEKVVNYIAARLQADVVNILKTPEPDISSYEQIIFASGIYFNRIHKALQNYMERTSFKGKKTALLYTCGMHYKDYAGWTEALMKKKGAYYLGSCYCRGYDTFGLLRVIGGIARRHPDQQDLDRMLEAVKEFCSE